MFHRVSWTNKIKGTQRVEDTKGETGNSRYYVCLTDSRGFAFCSCLCTHFPCSKLSESNHVKQWAPDIALLKLQKIIALLSMRKQ